MQRIYTCKVSNSRKVVLAREKGPFGPPCKDLTFTRKGFSSYLLNIPAVGQNVVCKRKTSRWTTEWVPFAVDNASKNRRK